jgi:hypothetical protein
MSDSLTQILDAYSRCDALSPNEMAKLSQKGVFSPALDYDKASGLFQIRAARVMLDGPWFDFSPTGKRLPIIVCRDERGDVADLVAWAPAENHVGRWLGNVSMIGEEACTRPRLEPDKLWVRESVLDWLQHGRTGVVILDADRARSVLTAGSPLAVKSIEHKRRLDAAWRAPEVKVFDVGQAESATEAA